MVSSVRPSARYARSGSPPRFSKGSTASVTLAGGATALTQRHTANVAINPTTSATAISAAVKGVLKRGMAVATGSAGTGVGAIGSAVGARLPVVTTSTGETKR